MKKLKTCLAFFICCILSLNMVICNVKADNNVVLSNKAYLLKTGMPQKEIEKLGKPHEPSDQPVRKKD